MFTDVIAWIGALTGCTALLLHVAEWRTTRRPLVIPRVVTAKSGNKGTAINLEVHNYGETPAFDLKLRTTLEALNAAGFNMDDKIGEAAAWAFGAHNPGRSVILALGPSETQSCSFGFLCDPEPEKRTWIAESALRITLLYQDRFGRSFREVRTVRLSDSTSFTGKQWTVK